MRDLRASRDQSEGRSGRVDSGVILGPYLGQFWTISRKPHHIPQKEVHTAVGRALRLDYAKYGVLEGAWVVPGIAPLQYPPSYPTPGTPPLPTRAGSPRWPGARVLSR